MTKAVVMTTAATTTTTITRTTIITVANEREYLCRRMFAFLVFFVTLHCHLYNMHPDTKLAYNRNPIQQPREQTTTTTTTTITKGGIIRNRKVLCTKEVSS